MFDRLVDGKIVAHNATADLIGALIKLGLFAPRPQDPATE